MAALARIREQARVQDQARREGRHIHELLTPVEPDKGLAALPEPSDGDVFFDLEGDVFAADGGLEYLFGVVDRDANYNPSWALDPSSERRVFECFIDDVMARWEQHPGFHIYHYGAYETTAVKRLMSRYATREDEVDRLLRGRVFVDLHRVVRQGLRASVESYSIKELEPFYGFARALDLATATRALIQVEAQLESADAADVPDPLRTQIEGYNRDDCLSTLRLAAWLEERRRELQALTGQPMPRPPLRDEERDSEQEPVVDTAALFEALTAGLPVDDAELDGDQQARRLLAHLLEFHRREDKSMWWELFHRCDFTEEEHVESRATLGALTYDGEAGQVKRSVIHRYRFPEQPHEIEVGDSPKNPDTAESDELKRGACGTVVALDETAGTIDLKRGRSSSVPHPAALVPFDRVPNTVLRESLARVAEAVVSGGLAADSPRRAAFDLLTRVPPRIEIPASLANASGSGVREGLAAQGEAPLAAVQRIAPRLDRSVLPVQGPPGSGKTYTGARMILDLLAGGKRVGVTANSHKAISNLLAAVCDAADDPPGEVRGIQKANDGDGCPDERIVLSGSNDEVADALATGDANLAAGTAWLWAREEMAGAVDVLVIDEAGQMSLANTLAVCQAAGSLVLLCDPRQLDQPVQRVHPPGADVSALGHLLGKSTTVDPSRGVFLDQTWRMHP
ncbi:MAG: TM0106 family RecB-like putative nuclease, partial [Acidobacteria bacterium]|nr:TM0106 family RecB-like putative nuclease [Acidobacteriota bacterium]